MEGMLCRWALALQEFDFNISYKPGSQNVSADALSRRSSTVVPDNCLATLVLSQPSREEICAAQLQDATINQLYQLLSAHEVPGHGASNQPEMHRYHQFWSQLEILDGIVCQHYQPDPTMDSVTVPVLPVSLRQEALFRAHDAPSAGHQGTAKTLHRLRQEAYLVGMARDIERHCRECITCQQTKPPHQRKRS